MRLLIIEDDHVLGPALQDFLHAQGYQTQLITRGDQLLSQLEQYPADLLVLDLNLPGKSGLEVLQELRQRGHGVPVLILTARDALEDRVAGLDAGADDYVTKPFELAELAARVRVLARRYPGHNHQRLEVGALQLDMQHKELLYAGQRLAVSVREFSLLQLLMQRAGKVVTKQQIIQFLSEGEADFSDNAVEVYIYRLRKRLEPTGLSIQTLRGFGYVLEPNHETTH
ncbi:DNA-binding response regulator [Paenalcaligenes hominis]|uniref:DNA-binding response regulator n=1 Tax=Paenalcaligenes hominis TaxID=643674 RepID=A0A1U9JXG6_9BURK|nr:response regulator transcription factor [Paenalcaligenes hominis]AQS50446.1 DNA-binding response regulator [Paenalcaligenes hominis]